MKKNKFLSIFHLPQLSPQVWLLASGRLLSQIGNGFTLFYAPIFFVNQVGIPATVVGFALGMGAIAGVVGRFLGGTLADDPVWGRKKTLILSAAVSAIADMALVLADGFPILLLGNMLMGLGIGLYWPATEAAVADFTTPEQRNEAFAITRLADTTGLGLGVVWGGLLITYTGNYRALFIIDGISFLVFMAVIYFAITNNQPPSSEHQKSPFQAWGVALRDRIFLLFLLVNILFTTYLAYVNSTMPLYFTNFVTGFSEGTVSFLFSFHIVFAALLQMPIARFLNRFSRVHSLIFSILLWGMGFILVWLTGVATWGNLLWASLAMMVLGVAMVAYNPAASSFVVELAPPESRGIYLSLNSQCWAIGYFIAPILGGWVLETAAQAESSRLIIDNFWLINAASIIMGVCTLLYLDKKIKAKAKKLHILNSPN
ncbi:MAG: MFS transporter [Coleofasciculaceae cyanobacterium SM2_1_6]|nr:MFS transporter [Coleofasciculaceae cyanobacterium SM2_1_6]